MAQGFLKNLLRIAKELFPKRENTIHNQSQVDIDPTEELHILLPVTDEQLEIRNAYLRRKGLPEVGKDDPFFQEIKSEETEESIHEGKSIAEALENQNTYHKKPEPVLKVTKKDKVKYIYYFIAFIILLSACCLIVHLCKTGVIVNYWHLFEGIGSIGFAIAGVLLYYQQHNADELKKRNSGFGELVSRAEHHKMSIVPFSMGVLLMSILSSTCLACLLVPFVKLWVLTLQHDPFSRQGWPAVGLIGVICFLMWLFPHLVTFLFNRRRIRSSGGKIKGRKRLVGSLVFLVLCAVGSFIAAGYEPKQFTKIVKVPENFAAAERERLLASDSQKFSEMQNSFSDSIARLRMKYATDSEKRGQQLNKKLEDMKISMQRYKASVDDSERTVLSAISTQDSLLIVDTTRLEYEKQILETQVSKLEAGIKEAENHQIIDPTSANIIIIVLLSLVMAIVWATKHKVRSFFIVLIMAGVISLVWHYFGRKIIDFFENPKDTSVSLFPGVKSPKEEIPKTTKPAQRSNDSVNVNSSALYPVADSVKVHVTLTPVRANRRSGKKPDVPYKSPS